MTINRRTLMKLAALAPAAKLVGIQMAHAEDRDFRHALTLFSDIKYPPDFKHFGYVNPQAPKGGRVRFGVVGSFDNLNPYTFKGEAGPAVQNDALLMSSLDEPSTEYGLVASGVWHPADRSMVVYRLRPEARFNDGTPITPDDVIWSMQALRDAHPQYNSYYKNVARAEQTGEHEVTFTFTEKGNRELPLITGQLPVLSKAWWTAKDAQGKQRNIQETSFEAPLGSGPYVADDVKLGTSIRLKRVPDYWGKDLPVNAGQNNFDTIEYIYFRDANVAFEAFKGDQYDWRTESSSKMWATGYDFPAVKSGRVVKEEITLKQVNGMQSWAMNIRLPKFQDVRVRQALNFAFDFEWANQNLFYGQYTRSRSYFNNSEMEAKGLPSEAELALLNPLKDRVPAEVFTTEYMNPVNDTPQNRRKNLRQAAKLLSDAGWQIAQDGGKNVLKNNKGEQLTIEFLLDSPLFERIALPYQQQLELLGIGVTIKTVDSAQHERRTQTFDFDIMVGSWPQSLSPGNEQRDFWGSQSAKRNGSRNYVGIANPAIDAIVEQLVQAPDRDSLVAACRALDRVLIWNHYVVPMWYSPVTRTARWDRFSRPDQLPLLSTGFPTTWWWDEEKAKKVAAT
ncbi:MAG: ABC transporter substrate-binding protein [Aestuariivirga sp.]|uniref:extracellular solute-binding protein n=1 Tax=Aestuariivirga sp. TaxID=2650926 RepID=UPI0025BF746A|nr:extracellular solute-binding protein [Aestuariivirga sp.]MCA3561963.1 ABC transporter substrate-binding protein [Aestuariivirga sp.]